MTRSRSAFSSWRFGERFVDLLAWIGIVRSVDFLGGEFGKSDADGSVHPGLVSSDHLSVETSLISPFTGSSSLDSCETS
jgi:hypothetical protein